MARAKFMIFFCLFFMAGSLLSFCAHASEWQQGNDADLTFVFRLVYQGRAEMQGNPAHSWRWRCVDKRGCEGGL